MNRTATLLLLFLGALWIGPGAGLAAQDAGQRRPQIEATADWLEGALILDITMDSDAREFRPVTRFEAEREIQRLLPGLFMSEVVAIPFDSYRTIGERIQEEERLYRRLENAAEASAIKQFSRVRGDLQEIQVRYRFPFYGPQGVLNPLIRHRRPYPLEPMLGFVPSRNFTGLVIYATGELPAHGKDIRQTVNPAVFPSLYDEQMNLVLSVEMCDPEHLQRWGMVAYAESEESSALLERIGAAPLRTVARGVFGINATDLLLPDDAVKRLLVREANRTMLSQGRILIVVPPTVTDDQD